MDLLYYYYKVGFKMMQFRERLVKWFKDMWQNDERALTLKEIESFFMEAALNTYSSGIPPTIEPHSKAKVFIYEWGDFSYRDQYFTSPRPKNGRKKTFGETVVSFRGEPIWFMQYHGWYQSEERVTAFLKKALKETCILGEFIGGRGPERFQEGTMEYLNKIWKNDFADFAGEDEIWEDKKYLFWHRYHGGHL